MAVASRANADEPPANPGSPAEKVPSNEFREPGRFGLLGAVTDDGFQFGFVRFDEHYEFALTADAAFAALSSSSAISGGTGDLGATVRGGPRFQIGHFNYFSFGAQYSPSLFGKDNGLSTDGSFTAGPYVSVERNFAGSPLLIQLWVLPYQFSHQVLNDGAGGRVFLDQHQFFQGGGFGLAYLF